MEEVMTNKKGENDNEIRNMIQVKRPEK